MPLSPPAPRKHLHTRTIVCHGYEREDGLFDIEAQIVDQKTYDVEEPLRGLRKAGMSVHDMQVRVTLDKDKTVRGIEVTTNSAPYDICPDYGPAYRTLIGARIGSGWRRTVMEAVGRTKGCTHITELLLPVATVAFQTMGSWKREIENPAEKPSFIDGCHAWRSDGSVVERLYPMHFAGVRPREAGGEPPG